MVFYRALIQGYIYLCGPEIGVTKDLSNILNRHALADQIRGQGPTEPVRVDIIDPRPFTEVLNNVLDALFGEATVRILESNE